MIKHIKGYNGQKVVEGHDRLRSEETQHIKEDCIS